MYNFYRVFEELKKAKAEEKLLEVTEEAKELDKESQTLEKSGNLVDTGGATQCLVDENSDSNEQSPESPPDVDKGIKIQSQKQLESSDLTSLLTWLRTEPPLSPERLSTLCIEHSDFEAALRVVQPSAKREGFATVPDVTWDDVGSLHKIRQELQLAILVSIDTCLRYFLFVE